MKWIIPSGFCLLCELSLESRCGNNVWLAPFFAAILFFLAYCSWQFRWNDYSGTGTQTAHFESYVPWKQFPWRKWNRIQLGDSLDCLCINKFHRPGTAASRKACRLAFSFQNLFPNG
jgi:hypothetical protein